MLALLLPLLLAASAAAQNAQNLTINNLPPPALGIDLNFDPAPAFTWQLVAPQTAYQLVVTTAAGAPAWDSGVVASPSASQVLYAGAPLAPDADYAVTLTSHTAAGPSAPLQGAFSTGPDAAAWAASAVWLGGCTGGQAAPQLRRAFTLSPAPVLRARAYASAGGLYTLHLNGARVGGGGEGALGGDVLTPGWATVPTVRLEAQAYDVAAVLRAGGENVVGLRLGEGKFGYVFEFCHAGDATCYAGVLRLVITQAGGNTTVLQTDASGAWECAPSPITFQHLFHGESYNASLEQAGWDAPGFAPLAPWAPAPLRAPNATLLSTGVPPIRNAAAVAPLSLRQAPGGAPYIAGGKFVIASSGGDPEVYWWADNTTTKNPVAFCSMCGLEVCGALVPEPPAVLAALTLGPNFTCSQLPAGPGAWVFDLGRNMAGVCSLSLPGPGAAAPGSTLTLVHGEILTGAGGAVHNTFGTSGTSRGCPVNTINCADQLDSYTFGPQGSQGGAYTPSFTFHGFRYVGLFGWPAAPAPPPTLATLTCHQQRTDMQAAGGLSFANPVLNRLQAAIAQTQASNFFSIPSDCPTREKRGWGGDASGECVARRARPARLLHALLTPCTPPLSLPHTRPHTQYSSRQCLLGRRCITSEPWPCTRTGCAPWQRLPRWGAMTPARWRRWRWAAPPPPRRSAPPSTSAAAKGQNSVVNQASRPPTPRAACQTCCLLTPSQAGLATMFGSPLAWRSPRCCWRTRATWPTRRACLAWCGGC